MTDQQTDVIADFNAGAYRDAEAMKVLKGILESNPQALMFVWEVDGTMKIATMPKSMSLARGMTEIAYGIMWPDDEDSED